MGYPSIYQETLIVPNQRSTLVAFTVGEKYQPGGEFKVPERGSANSTQLIELLQVIGAHTDSPVLKVKPVSAKTANGYIQVMSRLLKREPSENFLRWQSSVMVGGFGTLGSTGTSLWLAVSFWTIRYPPSRVESAGSHHSLPFPRRGVLSVGLFTCQGLFCEFPTSASTCKALRSGASLHQTRRHTCSPYWPWSRSH